MGGPYVQQHFLVLTPPAFYLNLSLISGPQRWSWRVTGSLHLFLFVDWSTCLFFIAIYLFNWPTDSVCLGLAFLGFQGLSQNLGSDPNNCSNMCVLSSYVHEGRAGTEPFRSNLGSYKLLCSPPWFRGSVCPHFLIWVSRARKTHVFLTIDYPGFLVPERHREHPDK